MRTPIILLAVALAGCSTSTPVPVTPPPRHEAYLANPTVIEADTVRMLLPASYRDRLTVSGLSEGWREEVGGGSTWEGTGACSLTLMELAVRCRALSVTLVPVTGEPETMIQAEGNVRWTRDVRGIRSGSQGLSFLMLRNDKSLER